VAQCVHAVLPVPLQSSSQQSWLPGVVGEVGTGECSAVPVGEQQARGELDTLVEPLTATTLDYTWDDASQLEQVDYGTAAARRTFTYDHLGRLTTDALTDDTPATATETVYDYDVDGNIIERDIDLAGNADGGLHEYEYDNQGRLISWTHDLTTIPYQWDDAGNRLEAGADTYTYDERNRLLTGPEGDYTFTPRGTLTEIDPGTTPVVYDYDPLGRLVAVDTVDYIYDGLDRVADREGVDFTYQAFNLDPVSDGTFNYSRTPTGDLVGISDGIDDLLAGTDRHGDLTHLHQADGTITDTALYDPYGDPLDITGSFDPHVGYQTDWTDPTTGHVSMGARWYEGASANFLSRDSVLGELTTPISLNRYTYAWANPLHYWDPTGHFAEATGGGGSGYKPNTGSYGSVAAIERKHARPKTTTTATAQASETKKTQSERRERGSSTAAGPNESPRSFFDEAGHQMGGFFSGLGTGLSSAAQGVGEAIAMGYRSNPMNAFMNPGGFVDQWRSNIDMTRTALRDPGAFIDSMFLEPLREVGRPWHQGNQGETLGRSAALALGIAFGPKVANRLFGVTAPTPQSTLPSVIYREGTPRPGNLTPRAVDNGTLSFRDSLSNPWVPPAARPSGWRPVFRPDEPYIGVDPSRLPRGSVIPDDIPPGHVSVSGVSVNDYLDAVIERGKFPK